MSDNDRQGTDEFPGTAEGAIVHAEGVTITGVEPAARPFSNAREGLDRDEREIKDNVLRLGSLVADQISRAIQALEQHDADLALTVITSDVRLNEAQRLISALVARTIATQQPVA